jgi:3-oxoacyl-(acyl-carrier-protein) synthase
MAEQKIILRSEPLSLTLRLVREQERLDKIRAKYIRRIQRNNDIEAGLINDIGFGYWSEDD